MRLQAQPNPPPPPPHASSSPAHRTPATHGKPEETRVKPNKPHGTNNRTTKPRRGEEAEGKLQRATARKLQLGQHSDRRHRYYGLELRAVFKEPNLFC